MKPTESPQDQTTDATEKAGIQVDIYGIQAKIHPADVEEPEPRSWKEVGRAVNRHLMSLAAGIPGLLAEAVIGTKRVIRGVTSLPRSIGRRIEGAHKAADERENRQQDQLAAGKIQALPPSEASDALEAKILELQARGIPVKIVDLGDGRTGIFIVQPEHQELAQELAKFALPPPPPDESTQES